MSKENKVVEVSDVYRHMPYWVIGCTDMGHRCGYVGVLRDVDIIWHREWQEPSADDWMYTAFDNDLECHGGLTFNSVIEDDKWYTPYSGKVIGFDCAHSGDARDPKLLQQSEYGREYIRRWPSHLNHSGEIVRTKEYCVSECHRMIDQLWDKVDSIHAALIEAKLISEKEEKSNALDN